MLIDSHCHLDFKDFDTDLDMVIERAKYIGVKIITTISTKIRQIDKIKNIAHKYENIFYTVGTHPHHAVEERDIEYEILLKLLEDIKVIGIGEAGLDYHQLGHCKEAQYEVFIKHIKASQQKGLPLIVHARDADDDIAYILKREFAKTKFDILLHCFSSSRVLAEAGQSLGAYFSFSGILTFPKSNDLRDIAAEIDLNKLLVETDAPYLAPVPLRGKRNEPSFVIHTAKKMAKVKNVSLEEIIECTGNNFHQLFKRVPKQSSAKTIS